MKRVLGMLAVLGVVGAFCSTHSTFASVSGATGQIWCINDTSNPFRNVDVRCWKAIPGGWQRGRWVDLVLPVLYVGGQVSSSGPTDDTSGWQSRHCPASAAVRTVISGYNPVTQPDNRERRLARQAFNSSFRIISFGSNSATEIVNQGSCCVQRGFQWNGRQRVTLPSGAVVCP